MRKLTNTMFIEKCKKLGVTPVSQYISATNRINVKDHLGIEYNVISSSLLSGCKPTIMSAVDKEDCFIKRANFEHKNKYDYSLLKYKNSSTKVIIICPEHGIFKQTPNQHINRKCGCSKCVIRPGGYNRSTWLKAGETSNYKINFKLYLVKIYNDNECFYKIGRTFRSLEKRFNGKIPYKWESIVEIIGEGDFIFNLEYKLHRKFKHLKYKPNIEFKGSTECFKHDKYILNNINKYNNE